jgi:sugar O-acyltransferase (sialic acid O-acetyltransferase NeuD family)
LKLLVVGGGGHGHVVADLAEATGEFEEIAFLDDGMPGRPQSTWPVAGKLADLASLAGRFEACVAATGDARLRLECLDRAEASGYRVPTLVHPTASVSRNATLGAGTVVCAKAVVAVGATLGRGCIVNTGATVDHDCRLAEGVHVCPGAHLAGAVSIGARSWFGIGAVAKQGIRIGADVTVGAGAVCLRAIPDGATVVGVPAREKSR